MEPIRGFHNVPNYNFIIALTFLFLIIIFINEFAFIRHIAV